ncbi:hypothetical protein JXA32_12315 [Candidatus Sumerlaeota bacterium]|nr:hypothetical protein [Candidatus Sumerlaeota bacterium]
MLQRFRKRRRSLGQAQTEYALVTALTFFGSLVAVSGSEPFEQVIPRPDSAANQSGVVSDFESRTGYDLNDYQRVYGTPTIPGLKDVMYIYADRLYRWAADQRPVEQIWAINLF